MNTTSDPLNTSALENYMDSLSSLSSSSHLITFLNQDPEEIHFMVDIETLDVTPDAAITEIGCITYDFKWKTCHMYHINVLPEGSISAATIKWRLDNGLPWVSEEDNIDGTALPLKLALERFFRFLTSNAEGRRIIMWCKGTDFDSVILKSAANRVDIKELPWRYNDFHDMRTLLKLVPQFKIPKEQVQHKGLEDAAQQWGQLVSIAEYLAVRGIPAQGEPNVSA